MLPIISASIMRNHFSSWHATEINNWAVRKRRLAWARKRRHQCHLLNWKQQLMGFYGWRWEWQWHWVWGSGSLDGIWWWWCPVRHKVANQFRFTLIVCKSSLGESFDGECEREGRCVLHVACKLSATLVAPALSHHSVFSVDTARNSLQFFMFL